MNALLFLLLSVPGPDSTAVVCNANVPESVSLAEAYRAARAIPDTHVCALDLPPGPDIALADYLQMFEEPFEACLGAALDRIEAVVLMRGVPLRVDVDGQLVSIAAAVSIGRSAVANTGQRILGMPPGDAADCGGSPCTAARWFNPFTSGTFDPGFAVTVRNVDWRLRIATMIHGRSFDEAMMLIDSAIASEGAGASGTFLFMDGADPARGVLDWEYAPLIGDLDALGFQTERVAFSPEFGGRSLAAFFVGTAALGNTIEGNTFLPGALVDNVTSLGAVPENFGDETEAQVSISRWVAKGVAGVHGAVDEPLNNVFPSRRLILDYATGGTLGEAYFRRMPYLYWKNLVLGDPMAAPYAERPRVSIALDGDRATVTATHSDGIESIALYVDGEPYGEETLPHRTIELLAVAQAGGQHRPKGWIAMTATPMETQVDAGPDPIDASVDAGIDGAIDAGIGMEPESGCACSSTRIRVRATEVWSWPAAALLRSRDLAARALEYWRGSRSPGSACR